MRNGSSKVQVNMTEAEFERLIKLLKYAAQKLPDDGPASTSATFKESAKLWAHDLQIVAKILPMGG